MNKNNVGGPPRVARLKKCGLGLSLICVRGTHTSIILYSLFFLNFIERLLSFWVSQIKAGRKTAVFQYDTPYSAANSFRQLLAEHAPLVLVFMSNFGHPITRTFVGRYAATYDELTGGSLALVVRSRADRLARSVGPDTLPYPLLCDADGVLYDLLDIPTRSGALSTYSLEAWQIMRDAKRRGYHSPANGQQQLPLTLVLDKDGTVLFSHYGASLTDVPADCGAAQSCWKIWT